MIIYLLEFTSVNSKHRPGSDRLGRISTGRLPLRPGLEAGGSFEAQSLSLNFVLSLIHVVNAGQVIRVLDDRLRVALRSELLLEVGLFSQNTHLEQRSAKIEPVKI